MPARLRSVTADDLGGICLALAGLGATLLAWLGPGAAGSSAAALALGLLALRIAWQDLVDLTIPDTAILALALLGAACRLSADAWAGELSGPGSLAIALDGCLCGGALLALREAHYRRRGHDGIGLGDVKLAAAGGVLVGTTAFAWTLFGASLLGIGLMLGHRLRPATGARPRCEAEDRLAFGAILAPALWLTWFAQVWFAQVWFAQVWLAQGGAVAGPGFP